MRSIPQFYCTVFLCCAASTPAFGQVSSEIDSQQLQRQQQRERAQADQLGSSPPDVRLPTSRTPVPAYPSNESPCFPISRIDLQGDSARRFTWATRAAGDALGVCLGSGGINAVIAKVQNALIEAGYVTSRVVAPPQDLRTGTLVLALVAGRIHAIQFAKPDAGQGPARASYRNALPATAGDLLNLRDIEQGLENFKRVPTAEADIQIVPAEQPGESDLLIQWHQTLPFRLSLSADDGGSVPTGKYQGGATLSVDNLLGFEELFYVSANRDLGGGGGPHGTRSYAWHYSMPAGYWLLSISFNSYRYYQSIAGASQNYIYSGTSRTSDGKLARILYRDHSRKVTASLRAFQRRSNNFIDDTEVEVQRRKMAGYELALGDKEFLGDATLEINVAYKIGTHALGTMPAPEEALGEGTSLPKLFNADLSLALPFSFGGSKLQYQASWRGQWNRTSLIPQDRFAIGGRYTVRGFDGESSLAAERGWLLRNEVGWTLGSQQLYLGVDCAKVGGPSAATLVGDGLAGAALGVRGQFHGLQYDVFTGAPLHKPQRFRTARIASGFSLFYQF